jgi:hypothetical protein
MKIEEQGYAIDDASTCLSVAFLFRLTTVVNHAAKAIQLDPKYVKAYYR